MSRRVFCVIFALTLAAESCAKLKVKKELNELMEEMDLLRSVHLADVTSLRAEIEQIKNAYGSMNVDTSRHNEEVIRRWCQVSVQELHSQMNEISENVNSSELLQQLRTIRNDLKQSQTDTLDLAHVYRTHETRIKQLEAGISSTKYEIQGLRSSLAEIRTLISNMNKEGKKNQDANMQDDFNDVSYDDETNEPHVKRNSHKIRHSRLLHTQVNRIAKSQEQLDLFQTNLQTQLLDVQGRLDRLQEPNWDLVTTKVELLELETKNLREQLTNTSQEISDFNKVHASILELREDVESIENKADATVPEFRKEISKLDLGFAQLNAQASYLKEDQENLRQSVKAIAVSVSNAIDRAELDRLVVSHLNETISDLTSTSKQHFYRLNDHILKSEQQADNTTHFIPLPELMGEVKELQPVEREYIDLVNQLPKDCSSIVGEPGTYLIHPGHAPIDTWCNNGSTLLQRRYNGTVEFNRIFRDYAKGFGDPAGEYWLGLQTMHLLTADNCSSMRIDMTDIYGGYWYAEYDSFSVGSADTGFVLNVADFRGNASDAFEYQNHMEFSALDRDRDVSNSHCAENYEGGWWYSHCQHVNINGKYALGLTWFDSDRNEWIAVATSEMRMRRRPGCS